MKDATPSGIARTAILGGYYGLLAWMAYATLEFILATLAPLRSYTITNLAWWYWPLTFTLWALYASAGIAMGFVGGFFTRSPELLETAGTATLALAFTVNLCAVSTIDYTAVACAAIVLGGLGASLVSKRSRQRTCVLKNPWVGAGLLLLTSRLSGDLARRGVVIRAALPLAVAVFVFTASTLRRPLPQSNRNLLKGAAALAGILLTLGGAVYLNRGIAPRLPSASVPVRGNGAPVVLISMDTVRADHLSVYGYGRNTTPNLARLAGAATLYRRAIAAGDMTLPTHAAMFTGMYASWNGAHFDAPVYTDPRPLSKSYRTLAELLAENGYLTVSVAANFSYFQPEFGFNRGFAVFDSPSPIQFLSYDREYYLRFGARKLLNRVVSTAQFDSVTRRAAEINDAINRILRRDWNGRQPVFLFANYMDAHCPYAPPKPFRRMFPGGDLRFTLHEYYQLSEDVGAMKRAAPSTVRDHLLSQYDGALAYLDSELGKLIDHLKEIGLYEDALIIVTSDHGEAFGEQSLIGHGLSVYQNQVSVPLIIKYPRQHSARSIEAPVSHVDLLPTILDVLGQPAPAHLQGRSLLGTETGPAPDVISESFAQAKLMQLHPRFKRTERALMSGDRKLVWSTAGKRELYDVAKDPAEQHDLCAAERATCASLQQKLEAWIASIPRTRTPDRKLDKQSLERLKSLGYTQ
jgi:arylsulfatase A-like enzyme